MCICFLYINKTQKNKYKLILAFNRDERINRQTKQLHEFDEDKNILAARDLEGKGTWLGVNKKTNVVVILTNFETETFLNITDAKYGRGQLSYKFLSSNFIKTKENILKKLDEILQEKDKYNGFNLIVGDLESNAYYYISNKYKGSQPAVLEEGFQGLCNCDLFSYWPKTKYGLEKFKSEITKDIIENKDAQLTHQQLEKILLQKIMLDTTSFHNDPEEEASIFVKQYFSKMQKTNRGTLQTTFILLDQNGEGSISEYNYVNRQEDKLKNVQQNNKLKNFQDVNLQNNYTTMNFKVPSSQK